MKKGESKRSLDSASVCGPAAVRELLTGGIPPGGMMGVLLIGRIDHRTFFLT